MRIAVTRVTGKETRDAQACRKYGHECYTVSPLRVEIYPERVRSFVDAVNRGEIDCIFFASAVPAELMGPLLRSPPRVIAIGPQTAGTLEKFGIRCETLPAFYSRDLAPYLGEWILGKRIGIPRADVPNPALISAIEHAGGIPVEVRCYGLMPTGTPLALAGADALLFTSGSSFSKAVWEPRPDLLLMAIGEVTAKVMKAMGAPPAVVGDGSLDGTLAALNQFLEKGGRGGLMTMTGPPGISGIVVIDKPRGPSSHQVTAWVGKILGVPVGHAGTLDPGVSGVLVVMLGPAVRLAPYLQRGEKEYICLWRLHGDVPRARIEEISRQFEGRIYQRPPKKAAVKRALRIRTVNRLQILEADGRSVLLRVSCDAGTYIRSLCHHMGLAAGPGGSMRELRRTRSGYFTEGDTHTLQELEDAAFAAREGNPGPLRGMILPMERAVADLPRLTIRDTAVDAVCHGASLAGVGVVKEGGTFSAGDPVSIFTQKGELVAVAEALTGSKNLLPGSTGLVAAPRAVFMSPATYPRGWKKRKERPQG